MYVINKDLSVMINGVMNIIDIPGTRDDYERVSISTFGMQAFVLARTKDFLLLVEYMVRDGKLVRDCETSIDGCIDRATVYTHDFMTHLTTVKDDVVTTSTYRDGNIVHRQSHGKYPGVYRITYTTDYELMLTVAVKGNLIIEKLTLADGCQ